MIDISVWQLDGMAPSLLVPRIAKWQPPAAVKAQAAIELATRQYMKKSFRACGVRHRSAM
jgi:hypothetical protein